MGQVVFITGASRGIGRATAIEFARAGFDLALSARTLANGDTHPHSIRTADGQPLAGSLNETAEQARAFGVEVKVVPMDLLDSESVSQAVTAVLDHYGHIDVLINNAIYQGPDLNAPFLALQPHTLARMAQGYISAPVQITQQVLPGMLARGQGCIINITSGAGESDPPVPATAGGWGYAYGAGKAAVSRLAGIIAREHGDQGIRAFTVNPGVVNTETLRATIGDQGIDALGKGVAEPELPAAVLHWLATSEQAAEYQYRTVHAQPFARTHNIAPGQS
ncbi:SDR family NAD(P)-dependent oxidoreductase [Marinobacterium weihaiense]|uniref:SDR family oxidoreductase n=1 Tax=Marinobacterium weihaiense TaxID=2851016 RepID=A0ABS6MFS5_9GAMM|nr:SDR family oxidoreductase [Marinobacterium weihaiense]MBV0934562.1 SDR family oxidoreductase [Marinobacterium weihaiense]